MKKSFEKAIFIGLTELQQGNFFKEILKTFLVTKCPAVVQLMSDLNYVKLETGYSVKRRFKGHSSAIFPVFYKKD